MAGNETDEIRLGSILYTLVEPRRGHEVAYNRWYERDHFYAGCMIGPYQFAGQRFVATRPYKDLRYPADSPITPDPLTGSYLALYFVLEGHHGAWNRWAVDQVNALHKNGRMFSERDHIHTALYNYEWFGARDAGGVPPELVLDHRFGGLVTVVGELADGAEHDDIDAWYRDTRLPMLMDASSDIAIGLRFSPIPLLVDAPSDVPRQEGVERRFMFLFFTDGDPADSWPAFAEEADALKASGLGTLLWAAPFIPTIPGTDTYTDQLW
jgi:hypothetical protein